MLLQGPLLPQKVVGRQLTLIAGLLLLTGCSEPQPPLSVEKVRLFNDLCDNDIELSFVVRNVSDDPVVDGWVHATVTTSDQPRRYFGIDLQPNATRDFSTTLRFTDNCFLNQPTHVQIRAGVEGQATFERTYTVRT